jgi:hypothetical protein
MNKAYEVSKWDQGSNWLSKIQTHSSDIYIYSLFLIHFVLLQSPSCLQPSDQVSHSERSLLFLWQAIKDRKTLNHVPAYKREMWRHLSSLLLSSEVLMNEECIQFGWGKLKLCSGETLWCCQDITVVKLQEERGLGRSPLEKWPWFQGHCIQLAAFLPYLLEFLWDLMAILTPKHRCNKISLKKL